MSKQSQTLEPKLHNYRIMIAMKPIVLKEKWAKKPTKSQILDRLINDLNRSGNYAELDESFIVIIEEEESLTQMHRKKEVSG